jgi:hypothetical protein
MRGIVLAAPIYYFLPYVQLPSSSYHARDLRLVRTSYAKTIIPTLGIAYVLPTVCMFSTRFNLDTRQAWNFVWQLFPL